MTRRRSTMMEDQHLLSNYHTVRPEVLSERLGRSSAAVRLRAGVLGIAKPWRNFTREEDAYVASNYRAAKADDLAAALGRSLGSVYGRAHTLRLTRRTPRPPTLAWRPEEDAYLKEHYGKVRTSTIRGHLGRTHASIYHRAERLGLFCPVGSSEFLRRQALPRIARSFTGLGNPVHLGYVAGIIDGEGSIAKMPNAAASVTTTTKELAEWLRDTVGGSVAGPYLYARRKRFGNRMCRLKPQYHWNLSSRYDLFRLLKVLQPHLVVKARLAGEIARHLEKHYGWQYP